MLAEELIVDNIPPLKPSDSGELALQWMDEFKISNISVVDNGVFLGTISENDVLGMNNLGDRVGNFRELLNPAFVKKDQHVFEVIKVVNDHHLTIVPVLDHKDIYQGSITIGQLMRIIADMPVANNPGAVIVIELASYDYSLQTIAGIIEENNAKILGTFITSHEDSTKLQLTIKINIKETGAIISSLQRHDYTITYFQEDASAADDLQDRFDSFMNFLNI